jgi:hypothetical protein
MSFQAEEPKSWKISQVLCRRPNQIKERDKESVGSIPSIVREDEIEEELKTNLTEG